MIDLVERHNVGDQVVDIDLAVHVPVDDFGHVGTAARAAESRAFPDAAGDELKWPRGNLLAGTGDTDDDAFAPAAVAAFQGLAHHVHIANAFKREISAAAGEVDDRLHNFIFADLVR